MGRRGLFQGALMGFGAVFAYYVPSAWPFGVVLIFVGLFLFFFEYIKADVYVFTGMFLLLALLAFFYGFVAARGYWPGSQRTATISLRDGPSLTGRILASGERGLLILNTVEGAVQLKRWDEVRDIDAPVK
jgi:hypothetical protein